MSTATPPPSIPPRRRTAPDPGSRATRPAAESWAQDAPSEAIPVPGRTTTAPPSGASTRVGWPSSAPSDGHEVAERTTRVTTATDPRPAADPRPGDEQDDQPTPLAAAVETATTWFKKAGAATSAALASATRPRVDEPVAATRSAAGLRQTPGPQAAAAAPAAGPQVRQPASQGHTGPRRVRLAISRVDPWSVMKLSFLLSVAIGLMIVVATAVVWYTLDGMHVFTRINDLVTQVVGAESPIDLLQYVEFRRVVSGATLVSVVNVFLMTALATIGAFLYNIVAALVGGVHVTMTDE